MIEELVEQKQDEERDLTTRQKDLYNFLLSDTSKWFTPKEIFDSVAGYNWDEKAYDKCKGIRNDKKEINAHPKADKIIVMKNRCFKIATKEEYLEERLKHIKRLEAQKKEIEDMDYKFAHDGSGQIIPENYEMLDKLYSENPEFRRAF